MAKNITPDTKIYVAGHKGLVGSAIWRNLEQRGFKNLIGRTHGELDLTDNIAVRRFFDTEKPEVVILAAAKVGGIMANAIYRADFIIENLAIQQNVITESWKHRVKNLLFLGSTCIYPKNSPQPIKEEYLLTSPLEYTNEAYAFAKIAGLKMCENLNIQYGTQYISVMPTNLYGPNDNFDLEKSHVLPAMIRKIHLAKQLNEGNLNAIRRDLALRPVKEYNANLSDTEVIELLKGYGIYKDCLQLWGSGKPLREFLWSEDMADASVHVLLNVDFNELAAQSGSEVRNTHINIGTGIEHSIAQAADMIKAAIGYNGEIIWNSDKPDGTMRKLCDVSKIHQLGWKHKIDLAEGINRLYRWYCTN